MGMLRWRVLVTTVLLTVCMTGCEVKVEKRNIENSKNENIVSSHSEVKDEERSKIKEVIDETRVVPQDKIKGLKEINVISGTSNITLVAEERNDIEVKLDGSIADYKWSENEYITCVGTGESLGIYVNNSPDNSLKYKSTLNKDVFDLELVICIPEDLINTVNIKNYDGYITVKNLEIDNLSFDIDNGRIDLQDVDAEKLLLDIKDGKMKFNNVQANNSTINIDYGSVEGNDFSGNIVSKVISGDIDIKFSSIEHKDIDITTGRGNIKLTLPKNSLFDVEAINNRGDILCEFDSTDYKEIESKPNETSLRGLVGEKNGKIKLRTDVGLINIMKDLNTSIGGK